MAKIIDNEPKNTVISLHYIFNELASQTGLHPDFQAIEQQVWPSAVSNDDKRLVLRNNIAEAALQPFINIMAVQYSNGGCIRKGSLLSAINLS